MDSRHCRIRNIARKICATALLCAAAGVPAQTVRQPVDAAGRFTDTERPVTTPSPLPGTAKGPASDVVTTLAGSSAISPRRAAIVDSNEAARRPGQAKRERQQGAERLPVPQARSADISAVNPRALRRQAKLRRFHEQAQRWASDVGGLLRSNP